MKQIKVVGLLLLVVLLVAFLFQNYNAFLATTTLEFKLFGLLQFRSMPIPLYGLILCCIFGGGLVTALYFGLGSFRMRGTLRSLQRQNNSLQEELKSHLVNLQGLEFIYEKRLFPELEYIFKHILTQEVAYNSLLARRRKEIHENIGKAIGDGENRQ